MSQKNRTFATRNMTVMLKESQTYDKKSLRAVTGKTADFDEIAKDCVAFANRKCQ